MKIYVYKNGSAVLTDETDKSIEVEENGEKPIEILDATADNISKYFPDSR